MTEKPAAAETALNLDTGFLKLVAALSMLIDHTGRAFFPAQMAWRIAGRAAFPIFAYCVVVGCLYTKNMKRYLLRLFLFAVISQPFYVLCEHPAWNGFFENLLYLNVIFTLLLGAVAVYGFMDFQKRWWMPVMALVVSLFVVSDYQLYGVLLMIAFYLLRNKRMLSALVIAILLAFPVFVGSATVYIGGQAIMVQSFAVISIPLIYAHTRLNLRPGKYFFYVFYPAHMLAIFFVHVLLGI